MKNVRTQTKRALTIVLAAIILALSVPLAFGATVVRSGNFGDGLSWRFDSDRQLTVSGYGEIPDYENYAYTPWNGCDIVTLVVNEGITRIGNLAFGNCLFLKSASLPNSLKSIGDGAFFGSLLPEIIIPRNVTSIGKNALPLYGTSYTVSSQNTVYSSDSYGCLYDKNKTILIQYPSWNTRTSYSIPEGVKSIASEAIVQCQYLESIHIPQSVSSIGFGETSVGQGISQGVFLGTPKLSRITVDSANPYFTADSNGVLFNKSKTTLIRYPSGNSAVSFSVPNTVTKIENGAFHGSANLQSVILPSSLTELGMNAFGNCTALKSISIPGTVSTISMGTFFGCTHLTKVQMQEGIESILFSAFSLCISLTDITIPKSVTYIGNAAFSGCTGLDKITVLNPKCEFEDSYIIDGVRVSGRGGEILTENTVIYGYAGSTAQQYAQKYERSFVSIGANPSTDDNTDNNQEENERGFLGFLHRFIQWFRNLFARLFGR